jgi:hypothetical protein
MSERVFATSGGWALASDGAQWILQRRYANGWRNVSFVRSDDARQLLAGLPETFDLWKARQSRPQEALDLP